MTDKKISDLTSAGTLDGTELVPVVQGGVTKKTPVSSMSLGGTSIGIGDEPGKVYLTTQVQEAEPWYYSLTGSATTMDGGTYTIAFGSEVTTSLAFDATAADITAALEALPSLGSGNVQVSSPTFTEGGGYVSIEAVGSLYGTVSTALVVVDASQLTGPDAPYSIDVVQDLIGTPQVLTSGWIG